MSERYPLSRTRKKSLVILILLTLLIAGILIVGAGFALYSSSLPADSVEDIDVPLNCYLSGNDIVVVLSGGGNTENIRSIELVMDEYKLPPGYGLKDVPRVAGRKTITYPDMTTGLYNELNLRFRAHFFDGSIQTIWTGKLRIS